MDIDKAIAILEKRKSYSFAPLDIEVIEVIILLINDVSKLNKIKDRRLVELKSKLLNKDLSFDEIISVTEEIKELES